MQAHRVTKSQEDTVWNVQPLRENRKHVVDPTEHPLDPPVGPGHSLLGGLKADDPQMHPPWDSSLKEAALPKVMPAPQSSPQPVPTCCGSTLFQF